MTIDPYQINAATPQSRANIRCEHRFKSPLHRARVLRRRQSRQHCIQSQVECWWTTRPREGHCVWSRAPSQPQNCASWLGREKYSGAWQLVMLTMLIVLLTARQRNTKDICKYFRSRLIVQQTNYARTLACRVCWVKKQSKAEPTPLWDLCAGWYGRSVCWLDVVLTTFK